MLRTPATRGAAAPRPGPLRRPALLALVLVGLLVGLGSSAAAGAEDPRVTGSAYGYFAEVSLFGGAAQQRGPEPVVELAPDAADSPQDAQVDSAEAVFGPATVLTSRGIQVHSEGSLEEGSVSSSATIRGPSEANQVDPVHYGSIESSCTADGTGPAAEVTVTDGQVVSASGTEPIPTNPEPDYTVRGQVPNVDDNFRVVFNEQTTEDGVLTVNAAHIYLEGPIAVGDVILGQSVCGIQGAAAGAAQQASPEASPTPSPTPTPSPSPTITGLEAAASEDGSVPWVPLAVAGAVVVAGLGAWAGLRWRRGDLGG